MQFSQTGVLAILMTSICDGIRQIRGKHMAVTGCPRQPSCQRHVGLVTAKPNSSSFDNILPEEMHWSKSAAPGNLFRVIELGGLATMVEVFQLILSSVSLLRKTLHFDHVWKQAIYLESCTEANSNLRASVPQSGIPWGQSDLWPFMATSSSLGSSFMLPSRSRDWSD